MAERHRYERIAGEPYYEEVPARAATFLHTAVRLRPFMDYNATIGIGCIRAYMEHAARRSIRRPATGELIADIRSDESDFRRPPASCATGRREPPGGRSAAQIPSCFVSCSFAIASFSPSSSTSATCCRP